MNKKEIMKRMTTLIGGLIVSQLGVAILILSGFGADPFNVLIQGFHRSIAIGSLSFLTHGCVHIAVSALLTLGLLLIDRSLIKSGTIACMLLAGPIIDLFTTILKPVYELYADSSYFYVMFIGGFVMLAYGMAMILHSKAGNAPSELIVSAFVNPKKKKSYYTDLVANLIFAFIGFIMGGTIGVGTLLCMAATAPLVEYFSSNLKKTGNSSLEKKKS